MKNTIILTIAACLFTLTTQAQRKVNLTFTAQYQDGSFVQLDSVQITNLTRSWSETLYYPDTILEMKVTDVSIATFANKGLELSSAMPNPFNGTTGISLQLPKDETVTFSLYDISGKQYLSHSMALESGKHQLKLSTITPQIYFLQVQTTTGSKTIKLLNQGKGETFAITHNFAAPSPLERAGGEVKLATTKTFIANDQMLFVGYRTKDNEIDTVQIRTRQAATNTTYTFNYQIGYKIGDVYYENGVAEGMVWWLADTLLMVDGVAYGEHGKLIALKEPGIPKNQRGQMWGICNPKVAIPAYDTIDGQINTEIIKNVRDTLTIDQPWRFQAMSWCVDSLGGDWYLPAISELRTIITLVVPILNPRLEKLQGAKKFTYGPNTIYWSSTADRNENKNAIAMQWGGYPDWINTPDYESLSFAQNEYGYVRAVKWF